MLLSIIVPIYNERGNIEPLYAKLCDVLSSLETQGVTAELLCIDDGSTDGSSQILDQIASNDKRVKVIHFSRNFGQTAAMMAGIDYSQGNVLVPIDADLQNDPQDIPRLLEKLNEGFDVCSGWRKDRQDSPIKRNFLSRVANGLIGKISGVKLHDIGCTLKAYRKEVIKQVKLYGEMHRFIPIYATWNGARVAEIPVHHHPRHSGQSKYGMERVFKVVMDLAVLVFLERYAQKPMYVFGGLGLLNFGLAAVCFFGMLFYKFVLDTSFIRTPLPLGVALFTILGFLSTSIGFVAEILNRTYYESQNKSVYQVRSACNI